VGGDGEYFSSLLMLFNSYEFIFLFLPVTLLVFTALMASDKSTLATIWLVISSLFFYGWWAPSYLLLLMISIGFNFGLGRFLATSQDRNRKTLLLIGLTFNLGLLAYYKYANFLAENVNQMFGTSLEFGSIILPLAISFFTFQQIAYLVDTYRGEATEPKFLQYCLFITFFSAAYSGTDRSPQGDDASVPASWPTAYPELEPGNRADNFLHRTFQENNNCRSGSCLLDACL
jgi:alginate O-acetyltransferase complex protein AlgI